MEHINTLIIKSVGLLVLMVLLLRTQALLVAYVHLFVTLVVALPFFVCLVLKLFFSIIRV